MVSWLAHAALVIMLASTLGISASAVLAYQSVSAAVRVGANSETGVASILAQVIPKAAMSIEGEEPRLNEPPVRAVIRRIEMSSLQRVRAWSSDSRLIADSSDELAPQELPAIGPPWPYQILDGWLDRAALRAPQAMEAGIEAALGGGATSGVRRDEQVGLVAYSFAPLSNAGRVVGAVEVSRPLNTAAPTFYPFLLGAAFAWLLGLAAFILSAVAWQLLRDKRGTGHGRA